MPFDPKIKRAMRNSYQRAFLIATLEEIKTPEEIMFEFLNKMYENLLEQLTNLVDILGSSICTSLAGKSVKHIIQSGRKPKGFTTGGYGQYVTLPWSGEVIKTS